MHGAHRGSVGKCWLRRNLVECVVGVVVLCVAEQVRLTLVSAEVVLLLVTHAWGLGCVAGQARKSDQSPTMRDQKKRRNAFFVFLLTEVYFTQVPGTYLGRYLSFFSFLPQRRKFKKFSIRSSPSPVSSTNAACTRRVAGVRAAGWGCACDGGAPRLRHHHGIPRRRQGDSSRLSLLLLLRRHTPQPVVCRQPCCPCCQCLVSPHAQAKPCARLLFAHRPSLSRRVCLRVFCTFLPTEL